MAVAADAISEEKSPAYKTILLAGLIMGVLDISASFISHGFRGRNPIGVLQLVASGLYGADSYNGGLRTAAVGLVCHFLIAMGAATAYYLASRKLRFLREHPFIAGPLFGIAVFAFMNLVVIPLSAIGRIVPYTPVQLITGFLIHMFCVGLPVALVTRWRIK